ncbi:pirin family protein [Vibrio astriarenae]|uniref:pirin family protein n=1 Tax=Vibrio astriarenae TaxID=1481923 RepID=UPI00373597A9
MISIRKSEQRGHASFSWLNSKHSFSFGSYYDPSNMGFSSLRVINDDVVSPGAGFETHGHRNMEIISFVLEGVIAHKDSEGNIETISAGEYQLMSAGSGIYHSEFNASTTDELRFLQIWIEPNQEHTTPGYQQQSFGRNPGLTTVATPTGADGTLQIKQDASLHQLILKPGDEYTYEIEQGRNVYLHHINGELTVDENLIAAGDAIKVQQSQSMYLTNNSDNETLSLIFDLPKSQN